MTVSNNSAYHIHATSQGQYKAGFYRGPALGLAKAKPI